MAGSKWISAHVNLALARYVSPILVKIIKSERHCFVTGRGFCFCVPSFWIPTEPGLYSTVSDQISASELLGVI